MQTIRKSAFTLNELMVVISVLAVFLAIFLPMFSSEPHSKGPMTGVLSNGRSIYLAAFGMAWEGQDSSVYPALPTNGTASSTAYFNNLMARGVLNVKADFFAGPGMRASPGTNLVASGNAWNVTLGFNERTMDGTPFLFTRNLALSALPGATCNTPLTNDGSGLSFALKGLCVVAKGGSAHILKPSQIVTNFTSSASMTNLVARP